jgi:hypothetical protein
MSELRPDHGDHRSNSEHNVVPPSRRLLRGLQSSLSDLRVALRDPTIPAATPVLRDYPIPVCSKTQPAHGAAVRKTS